MWLAACSFEVPDGILATLTTAQLSGKPHQGVLAKNLASPPGIGECNSTAAIGLQASLALNRLRQSERARYYGSALGRFTSPDPKGIPDEFDNPQAWNKYAYSGNNPLRYTDPDGKDWKDVVAGTFNAVWSDNTFGAGRQPGNSDFRTGQAIGDGIAMVQGGAQMIAGAAGDIGGTLLDLTGVGAVIGVPAQAVSTALGLDGVGVAGTAAGNLITQASAIGPKEGVSGGPGGGKRIPDQTKAAALDENTTANGGQAKYVFCGDPVGEGTGNKINYDHANPKSQNGSGTDLGNVNVACEYCNKSKGTSPAPKNPKYPDQQ
jgi:RHS repeat-associated protein